MNAIENLWLIDDDEIFVFITRKIIEKNSNTRQVTVFKNGQKAIDHFRELTVIEENLPEIIFLDLMMPVLDGWGFLDEYIPLYQKLKKKITLYILSSSVSPHDIVRAKSIIEVENFIIKPLSKEVFISLIADYNHKVSGMNS